ncbi:MAG: HAD hydrolase family protein [bacterium]|nr:HAD hydrolase family protein [bacterium]
MTDLTEHLRRIRFIVCDVDGVLTDGSIVFDGEGRPSRAFNARDATALTMWHLSGGKSALVSGLGSKAVESIGAYWKCAEVHMWIKDKRRICEEIATRHGIGLDEMAFLGDDLIDVRAMEACGLGVAPADGSREALAAADLVMDAPGGNGPLRGFVYRVLEAQDRLDEVIELYCDRSNGPQ